MSIADNLTITELSPFGSGGLVVPDAAAAAPRAEWIRTLGVRCAGPAQAVGELSGGNQQKVAIARLLYHGVDVLVLDEPTRGIDVGEQGADLRAHRRARRRDARPAPKAVLLVSSYLPELLGVCDRIAVMCRGRLQPPRPVAELTEHDLMVATMTGGAAGIMTARSLLDRTGALLGWSLVALVFTALAGRSSSSPATSS